MTSPAQEQAQWVAWIWGQPGAAPPASLRGVGPHPLARGLAAYREHAKALAVRTLAARHPLLQQWLGEAAFAGMAWAYGRAHPPEHGDIDRWGGQLARFLEAQPGMDPEPPALARLEAHLHALNECADDPPPDATLWQRLARGDAAQLRLRWSPSLALFALPETLGALLAGGAEPLPVSEGQAVVAWRRGWRPCYAAVPDGIAAWLALSLAGSTVHVALAHVLAQHPRFDFGTALALGWSQGWLLGVEDVLPAPA